MRINEVISEGSFGSTIATGMGVAGAGVGQAMKSAALGALGLKNTQAQYQQKHAIGGYDWKNAQQTMQDLGMKQGMDFELSPGQKVKIVKTDNLGATYLDPKTKLPTTLGKDALLSIMQQRQALQQVAQMGQKPNQSAQAPTMQ